MFIKLQLLLSKARSLRLHYFGEVGGHRTFCLVRVEDLVGGFKEVNDIDLAMGGHLIVHFEPIFHLTEL